MNHLCLVVWMLILTTFVTISQPQPAAATSQIHNLTQELFNLHRQYTQTENPTDKTVLQYRLEFLARQRFGLLGQLALSNPATIIPVLLPEQVTRRFPDPLQPFFETSVDLDGNLELVHTDNLDRNVAENILYLVTQNGHRYRLITANPHKFQPGSRLRIHGYSLNGMLLYDDSDPQAVSLLSTPPPVSYAPAVKKVAVIMINFQNNPTEPWTIESTRPIVFTGTNSANAFFNEGSFAQWTLEGHLRPDGDLFGWYTIPYDNTTCSDFSWFSAARTAAAADGYVLSNYTNTIVAFPSTSACSYRGAAMGGGSQVWINGSLYTGLLAHEMGHNYDAHHSATLSCTDAAGARVTLSRTCTASAYGDPFNVMGSPSSNKHYSSFHKGQVGWLEESNMLTITHSGTYTLVPQETPNSGLKALRFYYGSRPSTGADQYFVLELRQRYGVFDTFGLSDPVVNGISIRLAPEYTSYSETFLLDMTPATTSYSDSALMPGQTFTDDYSGVSITVNSLVPNQSATVDVALNGPPCIHNQPTITLSPTSQWGNPGQALSYSATMTNTDTSTCLTSPFSLYPTLPLGFVQTPAGFNETLDPGQSVTRTFSITSGTASNEGLYPFTQTLTNTAFPEFHAAATANYNVTFTIATPTVSQDIPIGDLDKDNNLDYLDLNWLLSLFDQTKCQYKLLGSCLIDIFDANTIWRNFGRRW